MGTKPKVPPMTDATYINQCHLFEGRHAKCRRCTVVISPVVAVEVCANMSKYGLREDPEGTAWTRPDTAFRCIFLVRVAVMCVSERPKAVAVIPRSLVSLGSVVLLQRTLIWILRAIEVEAHAIPQNGWIPGCGAENRTTNCGICVFIQRLLIRRRVRADPSEPCSPGEFKGNSRICIRAILIASMLQVEQSGTS